MLRARPKRILYRIIIPFTLLFGLTTLSTWFLSAYFITRYLDQSLKQQMEQVTGTISQFRFILNPMMLHQLKQVINAEIVIFDTNGRIYTSTFLDPHILDTARINPADFYSHSPEGRDMQLGGGKYRTIIRPLALGDEGNAFLSLWMPMDKADSLRQKIVFSMGGITLLGILAMAGIGYYIARSITSPVEELVEVTTRVSRGDRSERARLNRGDEIGTLADSFNHMIDEIQNFEERLVKSERLATAGQMAAGLAHEIRNPLTSIKMLGQVLQRRLEDEPENQEMLSSLVKEIDRLDRIIQEMIERTRTGELKREWGNINRQVEEVLRVAEEGITAENISIIQNLAEHLPEIYMDGGKLKQVLWNLILNAKDAMPGGGRLTLSTKVTDGGFVEISVEDTGRGISSIDTESLFQPFLTTKPGGMGLGLTVSRDIVEKHGGKLTLENRPEGGTKARVVLPTHSE